MSLVDLGRRRRHDPANRRHQTPHRKATPHLSVRHPLRARHVDQFYLGACVGGAGTNLLNCSIGWRSRTVFNKAVRIGKAGRTYLGNDDLIVNYHESTVRDPFDGEYPPEDTGSSALGLMDYWRELGVITDFDWVIDGGMDPLIATLQHRPVLFGSYWFDDMMTTGGGLAYPLVTSQCEGVFDLDDSGGHEYLGNAVIWRGGRWWFGFEQSWGEDPPEFDPTFYMRDDLVEHLIFGLAGDVAVPKLL